MIFLQIKMTALTKFIFSCAIIFFIIHADFTTGDEFYKFIGKDGVVHFSDNISVVSGTDGDFLAFEDPISVESVNVLDGSEMIAAQKKSPVEMSIDSTFTIKGDLNFGTGFFISPDGYAITCRHVIEDDDNHLAVLNDGSEFPIGVISLNEKHDLALIIVLVRGKTPYLSIGDPLDMAQGDRVFAVGNSLGLQGTITGGIFTGVRENVETGSNVVQFSAPVNPGNSGGPLIDDKGKAIGVVSWEMVSKGGVTLSNVGFAVPSSYLISEYGHYLK